jgi:hypothetical protein
MTRTSIVILILLAACKDNATPKDNPQTQLDLDACKKNLAEKDKLIEAESAENATLMRGGSGGSGAEIIVTIEDKATAAASQEFIDLVAKSRGAIQKCYTLALKKRADIQARTITLTVSATFAQSGAYHDASFSPSLGAEFDSCMKTLASRWTLPANSPAMTFRAPVSLTPS